LFCFVLIYFCIFIFQSELNSGLFNSSSPLQGTTNRVLAWKKNVEDPTGTVVARFGNPFHTSRKQDRSLTLTPLMSGKKHNIPVQCEDGGDPSLPLPEEAVLSPVELAQTLDALKNTVELLPPPPPPPASETSPKQCKVFSVIDLLNNPSVDDHIPRARSVSESRSITFGIELGQTEDIMSSGFNVLLVKDQAALKHVAYHIIFSMVDSNVQMSKNSLKEYVHEVSVHYRPNPFHNFHHAVSVLHFLAVMLNTAQAAHVVNETNIYAFLLSALVHDVDHPGKTNLFEINSGSPLAMLYNDASVLENHHCSIGFELMQKPGMNVLSRLPVEQRKEIRKTMIGCILATDMSQHSDLMDEASLLRPLLSQPLDFTQQIFMGKIFLHAADLSGPCKEFDVAREWASRVTAEFNAQVVVEQELGLPVLSFMAVADEKTFFNNEIGFSGFFVAPLWRIVSKLCPELGFVHRQLEENINQYKALKKGEEKEEYDHERNLPTE
jgi:hypothetical protein